MYVRYSILTWSIVPKEWLGLYVRTGIQQNGGIGVSLYIGKANFTFPQMLYESKYHWL